MLWLHCSGKCAKNQNGTVCRAGFDKCHGANNPRAAKPFNCLKSGLARKLYEFSALQHCQSDLDFPASIMDQNLSIAVIEPDPKRAQEISEALNDGGWHNVIVLAEPSALARVIQTHQPDIVLIDLANPDRDTVEHLSLMSDARSRPVAMFVDRSDASLSKAAIAAGLSAYVVGGLQKERIKPVLETAIARFQMMSQMQTELSAAKQALEDRKTLDRAKGLLMRARGLSENEAYSLLRRTAMDQNRKVADVANALVTAAELLK